MKVTKHGAIVALGGALVLGAWFAGSDQVHAAEQDSQQETQKTGEVNTEGNILDTATWSDMASANVKEYADIRKEADVNAEDTGILLPGHAVTVVNKGDIWSEVSSNGITGYVENANLVYGEEARLHYKNAVGFDATVTSEGVGLNVRLSGDINSGVINSLADGSSIEVSNVVGDWYQLDDMDGYVFAEYVALDNQLQGAITQAEYEQRKAAEAEAAQKAAAEAEAAQKAAAASGRGISLNADEMNLFAALVQCEAGGESREGKVAVAAVVINRMTSGVFPGTLNEVVYASGQFAPTWDGSLDNALASGPREDCVEAVNAALAGENPIGDCLYFNSGAGQGIQIGNQHFY